jgi:membrane protein DedA with SNARE-associated domain
LDRQTFIIMSVIVGFILFPVALYASEAIMEIADFKSKDYIVFRALIGLFFATYILVIRFILHKKYTQK